MVSLVLFYLIGALCLGGAIMVVATRNIIHAALALLVSLLGVAGLYLLVFAQFLALVQVLIYGGAIIIVVLFAIMLTRMEDFQARAHNAQWALAAVAAVGIFGVLAATFLEGSPLSGKAQGLAFQDLGSILFTQWAVPFEIASLVLLVALIGAVVLARDIGGKE